MIDSRHLGFSRRVKRLAGFITRLHGSRVMRGTLESSVCNCLISESPVREAETRHRDFVMSLTRCVAGSNMHGMFARFSIKLDLYSYCMQILATTRFYLFLYCKIKRQKMIEKKKGRAIQVRKFWSK